MIDIFEKIYSSSKEEYFKRLEQLLHKNKKKFIITANPETIMTSEFDNDVKKMLLDEKNDVIPDGIAIVKASNMLGINIKERITGIDVSNELLKLGNNLKKSIYFFGAKEEVINDLVKMVNQKYPNIKIAGAKNGYIEDKEEIFKDIIKTKPDIIMVALGIPHQEKIIYKHLDKFKKGIFIGVGGSFDVLSGHKKRAPKIFIKLNLEWLYRIIKEPTRLKRFWNNNVKFLFKIRKLKYKGDKNE